MEKQRDDQYYTVHEIAKIWKLSPKTVYGWISLRKIPFEKLGKIVRIPARGFREWIERETDEKL